MTDREGVERGQGSQHGCNFHRMGNFGIKSIFDEALKAVVLVVSVWWLLVVVDSLSNRPM